MTTKNYIGFTLDLKKFGNFVAQDPTALAELMEGVNQVSIEGQPAKLTDKLGAANLSGGNGDAADWYTLFVSTDINKQSGEAGLFYRNKTKGGAGDRIQLRLKQQPKSYATAAPSATPALQPSAPLQAIADKMGVGLADLVAALVQGGAMKPAQTAESITAPKMDDDIDGVPL